METNTTQAGTGNATLVIASYKKAQVFRRDYVRHNGAFVRFEKSSANHSFARVTLAAGDKMDARGSSYELGATRWNAADCQSWACFEARDGGVVALNFDGQEIKLPNWARVIEAPAAALELPPVAAVAAVIIAVAAQAEFLF